MMERYFILVVMLVPWVVGCQGQRNLNTGQLHSRVQTLTSEVEQLSKKLAELQLSQTASTTNAVPTTEKSSFTYPELPLNLADGITLRGDTPRDEVGFYVSLTYDVELGKGMELKFDTVSENIGGAYNPNSAQFICPVSGTYLLSLNIACQKDSYVEAAVQISGVNGSKRHVLDTVCDHRRRTLLGDNSMYKTMYCGNTQNSATAIVSLNYGDKVAVKKIWPDAGVSIIAGKGFSAFSSYLLRPS